MTKILRCTAALIFLFCTTTVAQQQVSRGPTDNGVTAGFSSAYAAGDIDTVNLFNGRVSLTLPFGQIGARGSIGYSPSMFLSRTFLLREYKTWSLAGNQVIYADPKNKVISEGYNDSYDYSNFQPGLMPAVMIGRRTRDINPDPGPTAPGNGCSTLTKLFLRLSGSEIELRDTLTSGTPRAHIIPTNIFNRGKVWHAVDGSGMLFLSDADINDETCADNGFAPMNGINVLYPTGYLMLRDGSRWRFKNGYVIWMSDANGNTITFTGPTNAPNVTDSIGRSYQLAVSPNYPNLPTAGVTYKDHDGASKTISVTTDYLSTALRGDFVGAGVKNLQTLFYAVPLESPTALFNPFVTKSVHLPNGLAYRFYYTEYGELARIEMPTGGIVEYDFSPGAGTNGTSVTPSPRQVYRVATARRVYDSPGHLQCRQTFAYGTDVSGLLTITTVKTYDAANNVVRYERHTFRGTVLEDYASDGWYNGFDYGREIILELLDATGTQVLRRVDNTWNTLDVNGNPTQPDPPGTRHFTNLECALTLSKTTLYDTNQVSKTTFSYDGQGNKTDTYDYDYGVTGSGSTGALLRRTHIDYNYDPSYLQDSGPRILNLISRKWVSSDASGTNKLALVEFEYDNYGTYPLVPRSNISGSCIKLSDTMTSCLQASDYLYTKRGNLTKTTAYYDIPNNGAVTTAIQYDFAGNIVKTIDARGYPTTFDYLDSFGTPDGSTQGNSSPQELNGQSAYAFASVVTNALGHTSYRQFNYYTGKPVDVADANGKVTTSYYGDVLDRLTQVSSPDGGRTTYQYVDTSSCGPYVETRTLIDTTGRETRSWQFLDGLGRPYLTETLDNRDPSNPYIRVDTQYGVVGVLSGLPGAVRASRTSNPYRSAGCSSTVNPSGRWTTTGYDILGRVTAVKTADGATATTSYSGTTITTTDQHATGATGKQRRSVSDALGRLTRADEPDVNGNLGDVSAPNQPTSYLYDAIGNLRRVTQGSQQRFYMYDSLSRLIRSKNPEQSASSVASNLTDGLTGNAQWSMAYGYDLNSNLTARVDARNVTTTYEYDALNRNRSIRYTDGTKNVDLFYDGAINGKGHFWYSNWNATDNTTYDTHLAIDQYDAMGRAVNYRQHFFVNGVAGPQFNTTRTYDKGGEVLSQTYPSGHTVNYTYDIAGRLASYGGNLGDGVARTYSTGVIYSEFGGVQQEQFGTQTALYNKFHYNVRGQLFDVRLSTVAWSGDQWNWNRGAIVNYYTPNEVACQTNDCRISSGPSNNGNIVQSQHWIPVNDSMSVYNWTEDRYSYDHLNRLQSVAEYHGSSASGLGGQDFAQIYDYDRWGNRTINTGTWGSANTQFDKADAQYTNRLYAPGDTAIATMSQRRIQYDAAGNQTFDSYTGQGARTYDAENHMKQAWANGQWQTYTYDAAGRRIKRNANGVETWYLYGMDGELLAEYKAGAAPFLPTTEYGYRAGQLLNTISSGDTLRLSRFVTNLYYGSQQRDPTAGELQDKVNQLAAAGAQSQSQLLSTASQIARSLFTQTNYGTSSAPARTDTQYVTDLYYAYLQRAPDNGGLGFWTGQAAGSRVNVCNAFEASGEFQALVATLYGTASSDNERTEHIVNNFYLGAYGTNATASQLQQQRDALNVAAAQGQAQVQTQAESFGRSLFAGQINDGSISNTQYVTNLYEGFLQRGPDAGGLSFWAGQASLGQGRQNVLNAFATCPAFRELAGSLYRDVNWLVSDHLGTPRMVVDKSGSLAGIKRHDYLPFGEELSALIGGRTTTQGYSGDSVRQKFTSKERDNETGLDYFGARYYGSTQGRFTSVDPIQMADTRLNDPQRINLYGHTRNNPLKYIDANGEDLFLANTTAVERGRTNIDARLRAEERANIRIQGNQVLLNDPNAVDLSKATNAYQGLVGIIQNHNVTVNYNGLKPGETVKLRESVEAPTGQVISEVSYDLARSHGGYGVRYAYADGTLVYDVFVPVTNDITADGVGGTPVPMPEAIIFYHEVTGHPLLDWDATIDYENRVRQDTGVVPQFPPRTGADHKGVVVRADPDLIPVEPIVIPNNPLPLRPLTPLLRPPN